MYVGGAFTDIGGTAASNIARFDGTTWAPLGTGVNGEVFALLASGTHVYAGGSFTQAGGNPSYHLAHYTDP